MIERERESNQRPGLLLSVRSDPMLPEASSRKLGCVQYCCLCFTRDWKGVSCEQLEEICASFKASSRQRSAEDSGEKVELRSVVDYVKLVMAFERLLDDASWHVGRNTTSACTCWQATSQSLSCVLDLDRRVLIDETVP